MVRPQLPYKEGCSEFANCRIEPGAGSGEVPEYERLLHPRYMAEEICTDAMIRHIRERRSNSQLQAAWNGIELALSLQHRPAEAEAFFNYAEETFTDMFMRSDKEFHKISANIGLIYMPAYRARYMQEPLKSRALAQVHMETATMLGDFDEIYDPNGRDKFSGVKPELVTLALFARLRSFNRLAYPASPREENTDITEFNHDSYVLLNGIKVPIQVKRKGGSGYDPTVAMVSLRDIIAQVNEHRSRRTTQAWGNKRKATRPLRPLDSNDFARLIVRESRGEWLNEHESWLLELGSMAAVQEVFKKEAIIRAQQRPVLRSRGRIALAA
jgi:hypothetical protein